MYYLTPFSFSWYQVLIELISPFYYPSLSNKAYHHHKNLYSKIYSTMPAIFCTSISSKQSLLGLGLSITSVLSLIAFVTGLVMFIIVSSNASRYQYSYNNYNNNNNNNNWSVSKGFFRSTLKLYMTVLKEVF